ncbi:hypothetical protein [Azotobacter beijerinckii]|uniref:CopG family transcriptional regulator n=1 Tax=Azotobacter beijerinckii TaxID=170623 RepID=A0A1I4H9L9_9GAMM|nr:hypothetical protein [Azotobacter beijerinckii]SFB60191.1 hypothetical protein SAMN04244571_04174 [Azotobacter beijerinckii]SFL38307.1 hypothetical protein SAMN04244574_04149 [Azotobacter beijerinckii]
MPGEVLMCGLLDADLRKKLEPHARERGVTPEELAKEWLSEKLLGKQDAGFLPPDEGSN